MRPYVLRSLVGLSAGGVAGALSGALVLILLVGPAEYVRSLVDKRPGLIAEAWFFTLTTTLVFAFWGAAVGALSGLVAGLLTASRK